jgi:hypothetical protein
MIVLQKLTLFSHITTPSFRMICKFDPCAVRLSAPPNIEPDQKTLWQSVFPVREVKDALIRAYVWLGWEPIAVIEGGVVSYIRADHIGRPVFATNATGAKGWTASYLPFGGVRTGCGIAHPLGLIDGASVYGYVKQLPTRYFHIHGLYTVGCQATSSGGVGYEESSDYNEGSRKICEYQCTRLETGSKKAIRGC